jgi:trimeric autotransporter adhesin
MPDLVMADYGKDHVITLLNTGVVTFSPTTPVVFPTQLIATESAPQTVTLTNRGKTALAISAVAASAGFQAQSRCGHRLAAGASCGIDIRFEPAAKGTTNGLVTIADSASTKRQVIDVSGVGTVVQLSPVILSFPPQKVGTTSSPLPVVVRNTGSEPITFDHINLGGANPLTFLETNTCGSQLAAGASCTISVQFKPKKTGPFGATLNVGDNGGGSPQTVALTGTGT